MKPFCVSHQPHRLPPSPPTTHNHDGRLRRLLHRLPRRRRAARALAQDHRHQGGVSRQRPPMQRERAKDQRFRSEGPLGPRVHHRGHSRPGGVRRDGVQVNLEEHRGAWRTNHPAPCSTRRPFPTQSLLAKKISSRSYPLSAAERAFDRPTKPRKPRLVTWRRPAPRLFLEFVRRCCSASLPRSLPTAFFTLTRAATLHRARATARLLPSAESRKRSFQFSRAKADPFPFQLDPGRTAGGDG